MRPNGLLIALICSAFALSPMMYGRTGAEVPGPVTLVQADPHHSGTLLVGTANAQLFRSRDAGNTWNPVPFPGALRSTLHAILIDPTRANVYFLAVSSETPEYAGVFRTVDEGATWQLLPGMEQKQVWALVFWGVDSRVVAAGTQDGVFLTNDGGDSWTHLSSPGSTGPQPVMSLALIPPTAKFFTPRHAPSGMEDGRRGQHLASPYARHAGRLRHLLDRRRSEPAATPVCSRLQRYLQQPGWRRHVVQPGTGRGWGVSNVRDRPSASPPQFGICRHQQRPDALARWRHDVAPALGGNGAVDRLRSGGFAPHFCRYRSGDSAQ